MKATGREPAYLLPTFARACYVRHPDRAMLQLTIVRQEPTEAVQLKCHVHLGLEVSEQELAMPLTGHPQRKAGSAGVFRREVCLLLVGCRTGVAKL